ncbi:MAG: aromatic amino acid lyase, partial [Planctomycetota bacterium]|nr:aromatic amino acid lyase [Planctomycetota bacterium]
MKLTLDGRSLHLADLAPLSHGGQLELSLSETARTAVRRARELVDRHVEAGNIVYGLTTGFGKLKSIAIPREDLVTLQRNLVLSHCCGVGEPMPEPEVRAAQVLRLNGLARGHSGVRLELVEALVAQFNAGFVPFVPQQGSVGASGDLAPLSHMAAAAMGHGEAWTGPVGARRRAPAAEVLR